MPRQVVDLTLDSDSDDEPARKRRRCQAPSGRAEGKPASNDSADDGDVVVVEAVRQRPHPRSSMADADLGDEDLVITGASGQTATRDLPHPRPDCAEHRFISGTSANNASFCPQCFCFVCDVKASECRFWGTGARERDHSNARSLGYWMRLREAARAGNTGHVNSEYNESGPLGSGVPKQPMQQARLPFPVAGAACATRPPSGPASAAGVSGSGHPSTARIGEPGGSSAGRAVAAAGAAAPGPAVNNAPPPVASAAAAPDPALAATTAQAVVKAAPDVPSPSSSVCKLKPLPDPSCDRGTIELGILRFKVKAAGELTISALAARLQRCGYYYNIASRQDDWGDRLALDNLFEARFGHHEGKYKSRPLYLKLLPLPAPPEEHTSIATDRVRKVLVIDCLGRQRATTMGVKVPEKTRRADLLAALAPMLRPLFSSICELLHLVRFNGFDANSVKLVSAEDTLDDAFFESFCKGDNGPQLVVYRTTHHPAPSWPVTSEGSSHAACTPSVAQAPTKFTEMPVYAHSAAGMSTSAGSVPAWVVVHMRQIKPPEAPDASAADGYGMCLTRLTMSLLVPLRKDHARGGRDAKRELNAALQRGLQPYRTAAPLSAAHLVPMVTLRGNRNYMTNRPTASSAGSLGIAGESVGTWSPGSSLVQLTAVYAQDLPAASYRLNEMRSPAVDLSASSEALQQSQANIAKAKRRLVSARKRKELPAACISELVAASRRPYPEDKATHSHLSGGSAWGKVAVDCQLLPNTGPGASSREGELVVKVFTWTAGALGRSSLFQPWDEWPSILSKRDDHRFAIPRTMELITTGITDPDEQALMAAEFAPVGGVPSTSSASGSVADSDLHRRVQAERRRARVMCASAKELCGPLMEHRSIDQLLAFMQSGERPAAQQPPGLTVTMRPYQLQSLAFMLELERLVDKAAAGEGGAGPSIFAGSGAGGAAAEVDPADAPDGGCPGGYRRLFWLPVTNARGQRYWYSPVFERITMAVQAQPTGGFLAEEMGLGKTVEVMALTLANPAPASLVSGTKLPCGRLASHATLVVCAVSLVGQWQAEAQHKTGGSCRIHPYHGQSRIRDPKRLATDFDVVVTTYQTLQSDHASGGTDPCQQIKWHRIVFDEGHTLKNGSAKLYKTAVELAADRKWLCTGTPINNAIDDLLGQFGAIHMMPLGKKTYFDSYIKYPFASICHRYNINSTPLLYVIRHTMIRHTKAQNLGGEGVLQLPEKTETDVPVCLSAQEQELYRKVHREALRGWQKLKAVGTAYVNSHLFTATSMLVPLRRICSGGVMRPQDLVIPDPARLPAVAGANGGAAAEAAAEAAADAGAAAMTAATEVPVPEDISDCPICVDTLDQPVVTRCNHWFCRECLMGWINASAHHNCPSCRQPVTVASLRRGSVAASAQPTAQAEPAAGEGGESTDGVPCESKLRALLAELRAMREADPLSKALVFTQFGQTLDWLKPRLLAEGFGHRTITGDMTQKKRTEAIDSFQRDPNTSVFLLSVRSGAVGINLTAANYVFLLEPCMNPAMEEQAIGRSWRMGQQRPVVVRRFFVKGSVEERIMEVVKMRRFATADDASGSAGGAGPSNAVPTPARSSHGAGTAVTGSLWQDKADLRINELELMFRDPEFPLPGAAAMATEARR